MCIRDSFQSFLAQYRAEHVDDVLVFGDEVSPEQEISAVVDTLEHQGRRPLCVFENVRGLGVPVATNVFASVSYTHLDVYKRQA